MKNKNKRIWRTERQMVMLTEELTACALDF